VKRLLFFSPLAILVGCSLLGPFRALAFDPQFLEPREVKVAGGADAWHPDPEFGVSWTRTMLGTASEPKPATIVYLVRDAAGDVVIPAGGQRWVGDFLEKLPVPPVPGRYTAEIWLEASTGEQGPHVTAPLLFDGARPGAPRVTVPESWFGGDTEPRIAIAGADQPTPISGLRGYAVSVDQEGASSPCSLSDRCADSEIDLPASAAPGAVRLGALPEGVSTIRVATVSGSGVRSAANTAVEVRVDLTPPSVELLGQPAGWAAGPVRLTAKARDALSGMAAAGPPGPRTTIAVDGGAAAVANGDSVTTTVSGDGTHRVAYWARDAAGNSSAGNDRAPAPAVALVRIDESPPQVLFAKAQDPSEPERIEVLIGDSLSGPSADRGAIAVRQAGSGAAFQPLPTMTAAGRLTAIWDSGSFPPGSYEFRATGYDRVGNSAAGTRRADGARMILPNPLKQPAELEFGYGGRRLQSRLCRRTAAGHRCRRRTIKDFGERPTARSIRCGHAIPVSGRLLSATGTPLAGMAVEVVETFDRGSLAETRTTTVRTDSEGGFATRLAPGPNRRVEAVFAGGPSLSRAAGPLLRLAVLAAVRMRASAAMATVGGRPVLFSGRVEGPGARLPSGGRPVELQFRVPGMPWSEFRTVQTDAHGRFRYAYAFTDDDSRDVRFQFRAVAPSAEGWPYETGISRPVFVTGR
jgi:hypothetical protein